MRPTVLFVLALAVLPLAGCPAQTANQSQAPADTSTAHDHEHGDHDHGDHDAGDMEKMKAELAKLSPEDAAAAEKQHFCPVSDEMLGTMGPPIKVDVNGTPVWICCEGCRKELLANPEKYLVKSNKD
jgi:hypothetical protein